MKYSLLLILSLLFFACKKETSKTTSSNTSDTSANTGNTTNSTNPKDSTHSTVTLNMCGTDYSPLISHTGNYTLNYCGNQNDMLVKATNTSSDKKFEIMISIQRANGTWDSGEMTITPGNTQKYWSCNSTGKYQIQVLDYTDWYKGNCKFNHNIK